MASRVYSDQEIADIIKSAEATGRSVVYRGQLTPADRLGPSWINTGEGGKGYRNPGMLHPGYVKQGRVRDTLPPDPPGKKGRPRKKSNVGPVEEVQPRVAPEHSLVKVPRLQARTKGPQIMPPGADKLFDTLRSPTPDVASLKEIKKRLQAELLQLEVQSLQSRLNDLRDPPAKSGKAKKIKSGLDQEIEALQAELAPFREKAKEDRAERLRGRLAAYHGGSAKKSKAKAKKVKSGLDQEIEALQAELAPFREKAKEDRAAGLRSKLANKKAGSVARDTTAQWDVKSWLSFGNSFDEDVLLEQASRKRAKDKQDRLERMRDSLLPPEERTKTGRPKKSKSALDEEIDLLQLKSKERRRDRLRDRLLGGGGGKGPRGPRRTDDQGSNAWGGGWGGFGTSWTGNSLAALRHAKGALPTLGGAAAGAGALGFATMFSLDWIATLTSGLGKILEVVGEVAVGIGSWTIEAVGFNQQMEGMLTSLSGSAEVASATADYYRRDVARLTPLSTQQALTSEVGFLSQEKSFDEADFLTQLVADTAFGLNPGSVKGSSKLMGKALTDLTAKGALEGQEQKQLANVGINRVMLERGIFEEWNADAALPGSKRRKLKSQDEVGALISNREVGSNMAINAIARVVTERLGQDKVGAYSVWATENTLPGLVSQVENLPMEVADFLASDNSMMSKAMMTTLSSVVGSFGTPEKEQRVASAVDSAGAAVMSGVQGFFDNPELIIDTIENISEAISGFDWESLGRMLAEGLNQASTYIDPIMKAIDEMIPAFVALASGVDSAFGNPEMIELMAKGFLGVVYGITLVSVALLGLVGGVFAVIGGMIDFAELVVEVGAAIVDFLLSPIENVKALLSTVGEWLLAPFTAIFGSFGDAGREAGDAWNYGFQDALGIESPSKEMKKNAKYILAGLQTEEGAEVSGEASGSAFSSGFQASRGASTPATATSATSGSPTITITIGNITGGANSSAKEVADLVIQRIQEELMVSVNRAWA